MQLAKAGAVASFVLTLQFLLTILWVALSWPADGVAGLAAAMAQSFLAHANEPLIFTVLNFYNISFALSATVLAVALREQFSDFPRCMQIAVYIVIVAASLYFASGMLPMVAVPDLIKASDGSAINAVVAISTALLLGGTMASGFALSLLSWVCFRSNRVPRLLCILLLAAGLIEIGEFAVPVFLPLDPLIGTCWSIWVGILLWKNQLAPHELGHR